MTTIIEKQHPASKYFKKYLKHNRKEVNIEDLIIKCHIEEDNRGSEKKEAHTSIEVKANFVEHDQSSKENKNNKGKGCKLGSKKDL